MASVTTVNEYRGLGEPKGGGVTSSDREVVKCSGCGCEKLMAWKRQMAMEEERLGRRDRSAV